MAFLNDIERAIRVSNNWQPMDMPEAPSELAPRAFVTVSDGWRFLIVSWAVEGTDERGYDGTAVKAGLVVRLTREAAKRAYQKATEVRS